jgi:acylphosphatase
MALAGTEAGREGMAGGERVARHLVVRGIVQGVGFRFSLARAAESRGVAGWVRNHPDGTVEAVLEGTADAVESVQRWCETGPRGAEVDTVEAADAPVEGLHGFEIR